MVKTNLVELRAKLQKLNLSVVQDLTADIILSDEKILIAKKDEFKRGLNPDGSDIGDYSSSPMGQEYRLFKIDLNPFGRGQVDLILTGALTRGLEVEHIGGSNYILNSTDSKWEELKAKYGDQISLLNPEMFMNLQKNVYAPQLLKAMRRLAGL